MSDAELPPYLTVGLHGVRDSTIIVTLPKYVPADGCIDVSTLKEDGYSYVVYFDGEFEGCMIMPLQRGPAMKVEIFSEVHGSEQMQSSDESET